MFEVSIGVLSLFLIVSITYFQQLKTPFKEINLKESFREIILIGTSIYSIFALCYFSYVFIFINENLIGQILFTTFDIAVIAYLAHYLKSEKKKKNNCLKIIENS